MQVTYQDEDSRRLVLYPLAELKLSFRIEYLRPFV